LKRKKRQVIIAVRERDLFDCLTLELSPACRGDELISIELGERATEGDQTVTRLVWAPDFAVGQ
jgi:exonuclease SbcC